MSGVIAVILVLFAIAVIGALVGGGSWPGHEQVPPGTETFS